MRDVKVDIVIPIYNAFDFTKKCIETVIKNTDLKQHTLVLVNDKSPDERILPMLQDFVKSYQDLHIDLIDSKENQGFVKSVNIGMSHSKNDVVLLNSDTEVTANWLDKMIKTAYIEENVATVTPLSNNATLASIPNFLEENTIPNYISLEEYAKLVEECSYNAYPELTTAHGFCMYIRRDAIEKVGLFDSETFGKGYGEENDFSYRCIQNGLLNLLCDNTFIYHKGTQSFTEEKEELAKSHWEILKEKYPCNVEMNNDLCIYNPYSYVQDNIKYNLANKYRKNMLIVVHEFFELENKLVGGTVQHIYDLVQHIRKDVNCHVFYYRNGKYRVKSFFENSEAEMVIGSISSYEMAKTRNFQYKFILQKLFSLINIDFVHIHHIANHYFDLIDAIKEKKLPYFVTLHDFYFICPTIILLENGEKCCVDNGNRNCSACLSKLKKIKDKDFIDKWRKLSYELLKNAKEIIAPNESVVEIFNKFFKNLDIKVIEHGMNKEDFVEAQEIVERKDNRKNIAFLGGITPYKGLDFMKDLIQKANNDEIPYNIHLFGRASEWEYNSSSKNFVYHNTYNRNEIAKILKENNIDLVLLLATWPETYSYTLTEATIAEVPVVAISYGALENRIKKDKIGWLLSKCATTEDVINKLMEIFQNEEEYNLVLSNIKKYKSQIRTTAEMAKVYVDMYKCFKKRESKVNLEELKEVLYTSKIIIRQENELKRVSSRLSDYHYTVSEYQKEIDRLNEQVGALTTERALQDWELDRCHGIEREFIEYKNHLEGSRKMRLLRKIKFIDY